MKKWWEEHCSDWDPGVLDRHLREEHGQDPASHLMAVSDYDGIDLHRMLHQTFEDALAKGRADWREALDTLGAETASDERGEER